ncbi:MULTISPECIES: GtrA family protein [Jeotgalicoccus]|jgi:Predicted membrane protein|uniref:GtrA family protein n=1 Tax=Jeotgalicoccus nanhaiensis TaxID=568603 RepID=A0ABR9XXM0_9STAP|nr:GtrA family protein [Jeotgalicoccus nanhaiensis]MBF0753749.1 GtrA family protein [Jeotgalicoccus nanhaiensis]TFU61912.1 GtrA family protein [Jeotgalicoccus nanhaiensis]
MSKFKEFIKYCMIAAVGGIIDLLLFIMLHTYTGIHIQIVNLVSMFTGVTTNFILNYHFNFKAHSKFFRRYFSFLTIGTAGFLVVSIAVFIFVQQLGWNAIIVKISATMFATVIQYLLNRYISFRMYRA